MKDYTIKSIDSFECKDWLQKKHYAKRVPTIIYCFGLFYKNQMVGVCTFGNPPRAMNNGEAIFAKCTIKTIELNRLVTNENLNKNALSFFVSKCIKMLPSCICIVSYADYTFGHTGYIYQATNWIYTGLNKIHERQIFYKGVEVHPRTITSKNLKISELPNIDKNYTLGEYTKKHRYIMIKAPKKYKKKLLKNLKYGIESFPKGNNKKYDASYQPITQNKLF